MARDSDGDEILEDFEEEAVETSRSTRSRKTPRRNKRGASKMDEDDDEMEGKSASSMLSSDEESSHYRRKRPPKQSEDEDFEDSESRADDVSLDVSSQMDDDESVEPRRRHRDASSGKAGGSKGGREFHGMGGMGGMSHGAQQSHHPDTEPANLESYTLATLPKPLVVGCVLPIIPPGGGEAVRAEILGIRKFEQGYDRADYYCHWINYNKRLDEWVRFDRLVLQNIEWPKDKGKPAVDKKKKKVPPPIRGAAAASQRRAKEAQLAALEATTKIPVLTVDQDVSMAEGSVQEEEEVEEDDGRSVASTQKRKKHGAPTEVSDPGRQAEVDRLRQGGSVSTNQHLTEVHRVKNIDKIQMGRFEVDTWYFSPFPEEFSNSPVVYVCEFCLDYFGERRPFERHRQKCTVLHPPGNEIYWDGEISFWEVDGRIQRNYCRNLSLLSKLFLDHKTVYYDVDPFWYYIMTKPTPQGHTMLGYFSKEKVSAYGYNLACILTLPQHQRKGYGKLLIAFSYLLSLREAKVGSPEKPLSDLGLMSYISYWSEIVLANLAESRDTATTVEQISHMTGMTNDDIIRALNYLKVLRYGNVDGRTAGWFILLEERVLNQYHKSKSKVKAKIHPECLEWTPPDKRRGIEDNVFINPSAQVFTAKRKLPESMTIDQLDDFQKAAMKE